MPLTPEQQAREKIDEQLEACGWVVQDFSSMDIHAGPGVAVREFPLKWKEGAEIKSGSADYLLYADGWAIGVIEAKPAGHTLEGVVVQQFRDPGSAYTFSEEFVVQRLRRNTIDPAAKVVITTVQRLPGIQRDNPVTEEGDDQ